MAAGPINRTGSTPEFSSGWERIFGDKKKSGTKKSSASAKKKKTDKKKSKKR